MNVLLRKCKEVLSAVAPVVIFVIILSVTLAPVPAVLLARFVIGAVFIIAGLSFLLLGVDVSFLPFGEHMGKTLLKSNKLRFVIVVAFLLGFFIVLAEPSVQVLASQVSQISGGLIAMSLILVLVALGSGAMMSLGVVRIVKNFPLRTLILIIFAAMFIMSLFSSNDMLGIAFDTIGASTGAVTVPLILSVALGSAAMKKDSKSAEEDSFGLVGVSAFGASFGVLIMNMLIKTGNGGDVLSLEAAVEGSLLGPFFKIMPGVASESLISLLPVVLMLIIFQRWKFHLPKRQFIRMLVGFAYAFVGLFLFFVGVNAGFMDVGSIIGFGVADSGNKALLVALGFALGMLIVLTEPSVHVLTHQIEDITNGFIKRKMVLLFLAIGVALSGGLSMLRIAIPGIQLWHYLVCGFVVITALMFMTPKLFVGIGIDSGAVAAGPMTATFVLAFAQGAAQGVGNANVLTDAFGVIAMVTMMPIIAMQALGIIFKVKSKKMGCK